MTRFVAILTDDELTIHLPGADYSGCFDTLCGMNVLESIGHYQATAPPGAKANCHNCFQIWRLAQEFSNQDFERAVQKIYD